MGRKRGCYGIYFTSVVLSTEMGTSMKARTVILKNTNIATEARWQLLNEALNARATKNLSQMVRAYFFRAHVVTRPHSDLNRVIIVIY